VESGVDSSLQRQSPVLFFRDAEISTREKTEACGTVLEERSRTDPSPGRAPQPLRGGHRRVSGRILEHCSRMAPVGFLAWGGVKQQRSCRPVLPQGGLMRHFRIASSWLRVAPWFDPGGVKAPRGEQPRAVFEKA
jgi:hypothetical protein